MAKADIYTMKGTKKEGLTLPKVFDEKVEDTFKMANGDIVIDIEAFELVKHGYMGDVGLAAVTFGDVDNADWESPLLHFADLSVGSVRGKNDFLLTRVFVWFARIVNEKGFPFVASGMIGGHV